MDIFGTVISVIVAFGATIALCTSCRGGGGGGEGGEGGGHVEHLKAAGFARLCSRHSFVRLSV